MLLYVCDSCKVEQSSVPLNSLTLKTDEFVVNQTTNKSEWQVCNKCIDKVRMLFPKNER